jgi:hypothetical protein
MTDITILSDYVVPTDDHARDTFVYRVQTEEGDTSWSRTEKRALAEARDMAEIHDLGVTVQKFTFKLSKKGVLDLLRLGGA